MSIPAARALLVAAAILGAASQVRGEDRAAPLLVPDRVKADTVVVLAHPDDEGVVAPLLAREALAGRRRVVAIYLTAGEAGSDRVGAIRGPAFGAMRVTELHWTLDRLGVSMFHELGRADLPPAADPAAVTAAWDRDRTVRELTRYLRLLRPDRLLTWLPGPASGHGAHVAAGGLTLLAAKAAESSDASPEQLSTEGLRPWRIPETAVFFQADKVAYPAYPIDEAALASAGLRVETEIVTTYDASLGRRYADLAREAMREQRSVAAAAGLDRGGSFDAPLRLVHLFEGGAAPAGTPGSAAVRLTVARSAGQTYFEAIAADLHAPGIVRAFLPEAAMAGDPSRLVVTCVNATAARLAGSAALTLTGGWKIAGGRVEFDLSPGEARDLVFAVDGSGAAADAYARGVVVAEGKGKGAREIGRAAFALRRAPQGKGS